MDAVVLRALAEGSVDSFDFTAMDSASVDDRLMALGLLMHASVSPDVAFTGQLLATLAQAAANTEYPEAVCAGCLTKFLREAVALEIRGLRVDTEKMALCFELVEKWAERQRTAIDATIKKLFSEALTTLINYVKTLSFTLKLAAIGISYPHLLQTREGILELAPSDFYALTHSDEMPAEEVFPALHKASGIVARLSSSPSRFPLAALMSHTVATAFKRRDCFAEAAEFVKSRSGQFTLTQRDSLLSAYLAAAASCQVAPDPAITSQYGKSTVEKQFFAAEVSARPTVANIAKEFVSSLRQARRQGHVDAEAVAAEWRPKLIDGEGVVAHRKVDTEVVEQLIALLNSREEDSRPLWKLVLTCLGTMGFREVENYKTLRGLVLEYLDADSDG